MMTAAAADPVANSSNDTEQEPNVNHSPPRFTAVNGRDAPMSGLGPPTTGVDTPSINHEQHLESFENWARDGYNNPPRHGTGFQKNNAVSDDQDRQCSQCQPSLTSGSKRKRLEYGDQEQICQPSHQVPDRSQTGPHDNLDSRTQIANTKATPISHICHQTRLASPSAHPQHHGNENTNTRDLSVDSPWHGNNPQSPSQALRVQQVDDPSDTHIGDGLQRGAQDVRQRNFDTAKHAMEATIRDKNSPSLSTYPREHPRGASQVAPKRKRVFSNRVKTGCITCRKRKKKCGEEQPTCNNCNRGGFNCEGYSRSGWQRPPNTKTGVPLQSKDGYTDVDGQYVHDQQHGGQPILTDHPDMGKMKSTMADDCRPVASHYNTSPTQPSSCHGPWLRHSWASSGHPSSLSEYVAKFEPREVPVELPRGGLPRADYPAVAPLREFPYMAHPKPGVPLLQSGIDGRPVYTSSMDSSSPRLQARMALSIEQQLSARPVSSEETEKEKMLRGELYQPFNVHLVEERNRCKAALWRFNNACNGVTGSSTKEQSRLLKEVLMTPSNSAGGSSSGVASPHSGGSMGQGTIVLAPFDCHYGYNIHIGEDVMISESCRFIDDCPISIGAHTWIGPAVTILSSMAHPNMQERKGSQSRYQGRPVTVEEDCYIGANCTIYPGVRLKRGAYVAPGEVVKSDIVAYGNQGLKPSYM